MRKNRGNILFLILLAVVLFAALAYAVTASMRGGGKDASGENMQAAAADMLNHFTQIDIALTRMQMTNDIKPQNISFQTTRKLYSNSSEIAYYNSNCLSSMTCKLFETAGGGVTDREFSKYATRTPTGILPSNVFPGYWDTMVLQWPGAGTDANDIVMRYQFMNPELCAKINEMAGITATPAISGTYIAGWNHPTNSWDSTARSVTGNPEQIIGKSTFSDTLQGTGGGQYCIVYHLLFAR